MFPGTELLASWTFPLPPQGYTATKTRQAMLLGQYNLSLRQYSGGTPLSAPQTLHIQTSWWANPTSGWQILSLEISLPSVRKQPGLALDAEPSCLANPSSPPLPKLSSVPFLLGLQSGEPLQHSLVTTALHISQQAAFPHGEGWVWSFQIPEAGLEYHPGIVSATVPRAQPRRTRSNSVSSQSSGQPRA